MKTFFTRFFVVLGVIFFLLLCAATYIWIADPFNLSGLYNEYGIDTSSVQAPAGTVDKHPALTAGQEKAIEAAGIDPAKLPTTITPSQQACATEQLGAARVAEIEGGASPTATEILTLRVCL